jgi:hypothetical protein
LGFKSISLLALNENFLEKLGISLFPEYLILINKILSFDTFAKLGV